MSNAMQTVPATVMAEAYNLAREQFGIDAFRVDRAGKKTTVTRGELGVALSGNKEERAKHAAHIALVMWSKAQYGALVAELNRVFPKLGAAVSERNAAVNSVMESQPELAEKLRLINATKPGKVDVMAMFALCQGLKGADKGEKAKLLAVGGQINNYELFAELTVTQLMTSHEDLDAAATAH